MKIRFFLNTVAYCLWILLAGALWCCPPVFSSVATYGVGGAPSLHGNAGQLRIIEQEIRVVLPSRHVIVRSVFRNEGPAMSADFVFPERGETGESGRFPVEGFIKNFRTSVDGRPAGTVKVFPPIEYKWNDGYSYDSSYSFSRWLHVGFKKGQTRIVRCEYSGGQSTMRLSDPQSGSTRMFEFDLFSGSAWKGAIGKIKIVFDVAGLRDFEEVEINAGHGQKLRRVGNKWIWQARNFRPGKSGVLMASWWPGLRHFEVDGQVPLTMAAVVNTKPVQGDYDAVYPQKHDGRIWVPLRVLYDWLPEPPSGEKNELVRAAIETYFSLDKGKHSVLVIVGSRELEASENGIAKSRFTMSAPAYIEKGAVMVELAPVIRALGGRVEDKGGIVRITWK